MRSSRAMAASSRGAPARLCSPAPSVDSITPAKMRCGTGLQHSIPAQSERRSRRDKCRQALGKAQGVLHLAQAS
jgi:hypothetical protein